MVADAQTIKQLAETAHRLRQTVLDQVFKVQSGHIGGSFSAAEILVTLYGQVLNVDAQNPHWPDRDRLVLAKGHAAPALYFVLAERGFFPKETLATLRHMDSILQGHPDMKKTPGVDMSTGSLGQGLSAAIGMALAARLDNRSYRTWAILGDGELDEGQNWEAAAYAAAHHLDNLTAIVDWNRVQLDGTTEEILPMGPLPEKWRAFGWEVIECDGHDVAALLEAYAKAMAVKGRPTVILAHTVKGKGVSFMENLAAWHGAPPNAEQYAKAAAELGRA